MSVRILLVNPNTTATMTDTMRRTAEQFAAPGTSVLAVEPSWGPESIEGNFESYLSAAAVIERVLSVREPYDAVVMAGFGEHGREGLQELLEVPVVDVTEAAGHIASLLGHRYSVVTTLDRAVPQIEDRLRLAGLLQRCASIRAADVPVLALEEDQEHALRAITEVAAAAVTDDRAEVIVLGCGGMAGLAAKVSAELDVPVVDPIGAGVALAEALRGLGLSTSKVRTYAVPRPKSIAGWPRSTQSP